MLPPQLRQVKKRIEIKLSYERTTEEKELLKELELINESDEIEKIISKSLSEFTERKIVSGPRGSCPCCGK